MSLLRSRIASIAIALAAIVLPPVAFAQPVPNESPRAGGPPVPINVPALASPIAAPHFTQPTIGIPTPKPSGSAPPHPEIGVVTEYGIPNPEQWRERARANGIMPGAPDLVNQLQRLAKARPSLARIVRRPSAAAAAGFIASVAVDERGELACEPVTPCTIGTTATLSPNKRLSTDLADGLIAGDDTISAGRRTDGVCPVATVAAVHSYDDPPSAPLTSDGFRSAIIAQQPTAARPVAVVHWRHIAGESIAYRVVFRTAAKPGTACL